MEITEVKVYPAKDNGRLKGYATIVFDNCFIVRDLKIIEGNSLFVSMPSRRTKDGFRDIAHPLNSEMRKAIEDRVIKEYNRVMEQGGSTMMADEEIENHESVNRF